MNIRENISLAQFTTLKIGGPARYFVRAETEEQAVDAFEYTENEGLELFVLGGGSNILVSDAGFDGLVLQVALKGMPAPVGAAAEPSRSNDKPRARRVAKRNNKQVRAH